MHHSDLPPLDVHAHIAADVSTKQLDQLNDAVVFAMTRSVNEARYTLRPHAATSKRVVWALGSHPGVPRTIEQFDGDAFELSIADFAIIGEIGLDRRGDPNAQSAMFGRILAAASGQPVLLSVHSTGRCAAVLDEIERAPHPGIILHWFNGTARDIARAIDLDCYFSVNAAMNHAHLQQIPKDRVLTETDFPASRSRTRATRPGDTNAIEDILSEQYNADARLLVWRNLYTIAHRTGAEEKLPLLVRDLIAGSVIAE